MSTKKCSVNGCTRTYRAKGYCATHYARVQRTGSVADPVRYESCQVEGCQRPYFGRGFCNTHYYRMRRNGTLDVKLIFSNEPKRECAVEGCAELEEGRATGFCAKHATRYRRHGDPNTYIAHHDRDLPRGEEHHAWSSEPTYDTVHRRVKYRRGPASGFRCVQCGAPAAQWSYDHNDPDELFEEKDGSLLPYSLDLQRYSPRCVRCHKRFDLAFLRRKSNESAA